MAIQKPNLAKFKKPEISPGSKKSQQAALPSGDGSMFAAMGKAMVSQLSNGIKFAIGAAIFFLVWGIGSFGYCMVAWFHWWCVIGIVASLELIQIGTDAKIGKFIKKLQTNG